MATKDLILSADLSKKPVLYSTVPTQDAFLEAFAEIGNITQACERLHAKGVAIHRVTASSWIKKNTQGFTARFIEAEEAFADRLEGKATELIHQLKPGNSPLILIASLNAHRPDKWRPNAPQNGSEDTKALMSEIRLKLRSTKDGVELEFGARGSQDMALDGTNDTPETST